MTCVPQIYHRRRFIECAAGPQTSSSTTSGSPLSQWPRRCGCQKGNALLRHAPAQPKIQAAVEVAAVAGYFAASHLAECDRRGQKVVVSEARQRFLEDPYHKDRFTYDEHSDSFRCPQGQTLAFVRIQHANGVPLRLYRAAGAVCQACPAFRACTRTKEIGRSLAIGPHDEVLRRHPSWMSTSAAQEAYRLRKQLVEPAFGIIKEQQGARRFLLRGLANVAAEWTMLVTAFNLRTLYRVWSSSLHLQPST